MSKVVDGAKICIINNYPVDDLLNSCDFQHKFFSTKSPVIVLEIFGFTFPCVIDTGSDVCCLSESVWLQVQDFRGDLTVFPVTGVRISGAFKTKKRRVKLQIDLPFKVGDEIFYHEFLLIPDLIYPIIIGSDFLRLYKATVNYGLESIYIIKDKKQITIPEIKTKHEFDAPPSMNVRLCSIGSKVGLSFDSKVYNDDIDITLNSLGLSEEQTLNLKEVLVRNLSVFSNKPGLIRDFELDIVLNDDTPFHLKQYPIPVAHRDAVQKEIDRMESWGVIERASTPYISPLVTTVKKNGSVRVCLDLRRLNKVVQRDHERPKPIPEILMSLKKVKFMSSLDLTHGYWQLPLSKESRKYTGFLHGTRSFQFKSLPFGLVTAVSAFTRCIDTILGPEFKDFTVCYLDDILIYSETFESHLEHLDRVLSKLREAGMTLRWDKCHFFRTELKYLGYCVNSSGVTPDPERVKAISDFERPRNVKDLQAFLGLCVYDRAFCPNFASCVENLTLLLRKKVPWRWTDLQENAFKQLKTKIQEATLLYHPNPNLPFFVQCDSSDVGLGAQLFQRVNGERRVVAYASRLLLDRERNYSVSEKETLAIVFALQKWRVYLLGRTFTILTDHRALSYLNSCRLLSPRISRWVLSIMEFDFVIEYVAGKNNVVADCLSRYAVRLPTPSDKCFKIATLKIPLKLKEVLRNLPELQRQDKKLSKIINDLTETVSPRFTIKDDCLFIRKTEEEPYLLCIPEVIKQVVVEIYHSSIGHFGVYKTWCAMRSDMWWQNMHRDIKKYLASCLVCQKAKSTVLPSAPLQPIIVNAPNEIHSLDLYGPLPMSTGGVTYVLVALDLFSKLVALYTLRKATSKSIIKKLSDFHFQKVGRPASILTDHGTQFVSKAWEKFLRSNEIQMIKSSIRHPCSNPVERVMRELGRLFRTYCSDKHKSWAREIPNFVFFLNSVVHESTGFSPYELHYGNESFSLFRKYIDFPEAAAPLSSEGKLVLAKETLLGRAARRTVSHPNKPYVSFRVGDLVLLRANPTSSSLTQETKKFMLLFEGPYRIKREVGLVTYILCDPESDDRERGMFHISHLKKFVSFS